MSIYKPINIILADDHDIFRDGFRSMVEQVSSIKLVAEAADGYSLINLVDRYNPDVVLTDIRMPGLGGIAVTEMLQKKHPHLPVIALSMFNDDHLIIDMLTSGAKGYLLKDAGKKTIIEAIETVYRSNDFFCQKTRLNIARLIATNVYDPIRKERKTILSKREIQILKLLCAQKSNNDIAKEFGISLRTVEGARLKMMKKTNSANIIGLYQFAVKYGLLDEEK
jgi:DNA-binding NarL/FixJ family response regulator